MAQNRGGGNMPPNTNVAYTGAPTTTTVTAREQTIAPKPVDLVRWGPIIAGIFAALATLATLTVLGLAIGLGTYDPGNQLSNFGFGAGIWSAISVLIAFFVGGLIASSAAAVGGHGNGILNGAMVWFVAIPLLLFVLGNGIGTLVGTATGAAGGLIQAGSQVVSPTALATVAAGGQGAVQGAQQTAMAVATNVNVTPQDVKTATTTASNVAWGVLLSLGLSAAAAIAGGYLGARTMAQRTQVEVTRTT